MGCSGSSWCCFSRQVVHFQPVPAGDCSPPPPAVLKELVLFHNVGYILKAFLLKDVQECFIEQVGIN